MSKRRVLVIVCSLFLAMTAVQVLPAIYTTKETIRAESVPKHFFIDTAKHPAEIQNEDQSTAETAAYAVAYVMRYCGDEVNGNALSIDIPRPLGTVTPNSIVRLLRDRGYRAKAYHGDLDTMKQRLREGTPLIVYLRDGKEKRYAVVTGFDERQVYLLDSKAENADAASHTGIIQNEEFLTQWKTGFWICDNVYITASKNAEP